MIVKEEYAKGNNAFSLWNQSWDGMFYTYKYRFIILFSQYILILYYVQDFTLTGTQWASLQFSRRNF